MPPDSDSFVYEGLRNGEMAHYFYKSRNFRLAWGNQYSDAVADTLMFFLKSVRRYGLLPQNYHRDQLNVFLPAQPDAKFIQRREALLTDAFLSLTYDLRHGRLNPFVNAYDDTLAIDALQSALKYKNIRQILQSFEPRHSGYQSLKTALNEILDTLKPDERDLLISGITNDSIENHRKIQILELNMERWKMLPANFGGRYVWINIPSYWLQLIDSGQIVLESKVIVGKPETPTPVLNSSIECITLYPFWHVPRKIAAEEYLPLIQEDTSFLGLNNFDVLDRKGRLVDPAGLDWKKYNSNYFPVQLRQREGPENALGVIKFVFDNPYAVFLHDTNAKSLFRKKARAFSHGCIRMENAVALAKYLAPLAEQVDRYLKLKERHTINLEDRVPIYIGYFTCESSNGSLVFYQDIYQQDQGMIKLLYKHPVSIGF